MLREKTEALNTQLYELHGVMQRINKPTPCPMLAKKRGIQSNARQTAKIQNCNHASSVFPHSSKNKIQLVICY